MCIRDRYFTMKYITLNIDNCSIELHNSFYGRETVFLNGEAVSRIFSIFGAGHRFEKESNKYRLITKLSRRGVAIDFYRNDEVIIESPSAASSLKYFVLFIVFILLVNLGSFLL